MFAADEECGNAKQEFHCPMPLGNVAVHCMSSALKAAAASWAGPRPPSWLTCALQEFHCPPPPGGEQVYWRSCTAHCRSEAVRCGSNTAHGREAVRPCIARVSPPLAP